MKVVLEVTELDQAHDLLNDFVSLRNKYQLLLQQVSDQRKSLGDRVNPFVKDYQQKIVNYNELIESIRIQIEAS